MNLSINLNLKLIYKSNKRDKKIILHSLQFRKQKKKSQAYKTKDLLKIPKKAIHHQL